MISIQTEIEYLRTLDFFFRGVFFLFFAFFLLFLFPNPGRTGYIVSWNNLTQL